MNRWKGCLTSLTRWKAQSARDLACCAIQFISSLCPGSHHWIYEQILSHCGSGEAEPPGMLCWYFIAVILPAIVCWDTSHPSKAYAVPALLPTPLRLFMNRLIYQQPRETPGRVACALWSKNDKCSINIIRGNLFSVRDWFILVGTVSCTSLTSIRRFGNCRLSAG